MTVFHYRAVDPHGQEHKGMLEAESTRHLRDELRRKNWVALDVCAARKKTAGLGLQLPLKKKHFSAAEMASEFRQLSALIGAGVPVAQALEISADNTLNPQMKLLMKSLYSKLLEGFSLSRAMREHRDAFSAVQCAAVQAGEHVGQLEEVLDRLAKDAEDHAALRQKMLVLSIYPSILAAVSLFIILFLLAFVFPQIVGIIEDNQQELPFMTELVMAVSNFVSDTILFILLGLLGGALWFTQLLYRPAFRAKMHKLLLDLPLIGPLVLLYDSSRFAMTLSMLMRGGVEMLQACTIAAGSLSNSHLRGQVESALHDIEEGHSLKAMLEDCNCLHSFITEMVGVGESSGRLNDMLNFTAESLSRQFQHRVSLLMGLLEPAILIAMGSIVLIIVISVMQPILALQQAVL